MLQPVLQGVAVMLSSFFGTLGFALLLHAPRRSYLAASAIGSAAYTLCWLLMQWGVPEPAAVFAAALVGSVLAQYCARRMRMIATVFLLLSIVALVPGLGLYRCMHLLAQELYAEGVDAGVRAMVSIVMIALGLGVGGFLFRCISPPLKERSAAGT